MTERTARLITISHHLCGAALPAGVCNCPGDRQGAFRETAMCWLLAEKLLDAKEPDRLDLIAALSGDGECQDTREKP
jgi:hypothetical protein